MFWQKTIVLVVYVISFCVCVYLDLSENKDKKFAAGAVHFAVEKEI